MSEIVLVRGDILSYSSIVVSFSLVSLLFSSLFAFFKKYYVNSSIKRYEKKLDKVSEKIEYTLRRDKNLTQGKIEDCKDKLITLDKQARRIIEAMKKKLENIKDPILPQIFSFILAIAGSQMSFYNFLTRNDFQNIFFFSIFLSILLIIITILQYKDLYVIYFTDKEIGKENRTKHLFILFSMLILFSLLLWGIFRLEYSYFKQLFFLNIIGSYLLTNIFIMLVLGYNPSIRDLSKFGKKIKNAVNGVDKL
jgi:hypothetical protein